MWMCFKKLQGIWVFDDGAIAVGHLSTVSKWNMITIGICASNSFPNTFIHSVKVPLAHMLNWNNHISAISDSMHIHRQRKWLFNAIYWTDNTIHMNTKFRMNFFLTMSRMPENRAIIWLRLGFVHIHQKEDFFLSWLKIDVKFVTNWIWKTSEILFNDCN